MCVVVAEYAGAVELVNCDSTGFAKEEFLDDAIFHCNDRCSTRRQDVGSLMQLPLGSSLLEGVLNVTSLEALNRESQLALGEQLVVVACPKIIGGNQTRETADRE